MKMIKSKGQSLLEVVIALGLLIVVVSILTFTTSNGLKNAQFSQRQSQAVQLAQESIDKVRNISKGNSDECIVVKGSDKTYFWNYVFGSDNSEKYKFNANECELEVATTKDYVTSSNDKFERNIYVHNPGGTSNYREIIVEIIWYDSSGSHKSNQTTYVSRY